MAVCHAEGRRDQLVMARNGDAARMHPTIAARDSFGSHLKVRGDGHPKSAAVLTPAGRLGNIAEMKHYEGVVPEPMGWQVFVVTDGERKPLPLRLDLRNHSPDGFAWGYSGSGPAQLALAILCDAVGDDEVALSQYKTFAWWKIANLDRHEGWTMTRDYVVAWALFL